MSRCPSCGAAIENNANYCGGCGANLLELKTTDDPFLHKIIGGRYKVLKQIGTGGMGEVYLAEHTQVGQQVAIKFLSRRLTGDPNIVQRFFNEARSIGKIGHPGAVTLNDFGQTHDNTLYIIMEFVEGESLQSLVEREGRLDSEAATHIILQLCDVLDAAHKARIVHRDLKPDNIMLSPGRKGRYHVKVLDFGVAKLLTEESALTQTGMVYGTPDFMSPEQATGSPVDERSDLYATALILYYMLCGEPPFQGSHPMTVMRAQAVDTPVSPREKCPEASISPALETIILRALQKKPDQRYASVAEFADEIEALQLAMSGAIRALSRPVPKDSGPSTEPMTEPAAPAPRPETPPEEIHLAGLTPPADALGAEEPSFGGFSLEPSPSVPSFDLSDEAPSFVMGDVGDGDADFDPFQDFDADPPSERSPMTRGRGQKTPMIIAGALLLVLLLGGAAIWAFSGDDNDKDEGQEEKPAPSLEAAEGKPDAKQDEKPVKDDIPSGFGAAPVDDAPPMVRTNPEAGVKTAEPPKEEPKEAAKKTPPKKTRPKKKATKKKPVKKAPSRKARPKKKATKKGPPKSLSGPPKNL